MVGFFAQLASRASREVHPGGDPAARRGRIKAQRPASDRLTQRGPVMSLVKLLPAWFHAIADYAVAALLILVPAIAGGSSKAVASGIVVGGVVAVVSMLTKYPLGVVKGLPFTVHSAGDYLAAQLLMVAPF